MLAGQRKTDWKNFACWFGVAFCCSFVFDFFPVQKPSMDVTTGQVAVAAEPDGFAALNAATEKAHCIWTISNFSRLRMQVDSPIFNVLTHNWQFSAHPASGCLELWVKNRSSRAILVGMTVDIVNEKGETVGGSVGLSWRRLCAKQDALAAIGTGLSALWTWPLVRMADVLDPKTGYLINDTLRIKVTFHGIKCADPYLPPPSTSKLCSALREAKKFRYASPVVSNCKAELLTCYQRRDLSCGGH